MDRAARLRLALAAAGALLASACDAPAPMSGPQAASGDEKRALTEAAAMLDERPPPSSAPSSPAP